MSLPVRERQMGKEQMGRRGKQRRLPGGCEIHQSNRVAKGMGGRRNNMCKDPTCGVFREQGAGCWHERARAGAGGDWR